MSPPGTLRAKIASAILEQLTQGLSPEKIALTVAVGLCIAVNPIIGTTTLGCFLAAWVLRLNLPIIQLVNFCSYAFQLLLIYPFIRLGERLFHASRETRSLEELVALAKVDPYGTLARLGGTLGHAVVAWLVLAPLLVAAIYFGTLPFFRALARRIAVKDPYASAAAVSPTPD